MNVAMIEEPLATSSPIPEHRHDNAELLYLVLLDPATVVDCKRTPNGYVADDIVVTGPMREVCPVCETVHLKLVLRQTHVKRAHMFCEQCTRCFDARYPDGSPALSIP